MTAINGSPSSDGQRITKLSNFSNKIMHNESKLSICRDRGLFLGPYVLTVTHHHKFERKPNFTSKLTYYSIVLELVSYLSKDSLPYIVLVNSPRILNLILNLPNGKTEIFR